MRELIEKINQAWTSQLPFVVYHLPNSEVVKGFFQKNDKLCYIQDYKKAGFVFAPFKTSSPSIVFQEANSEVVKFELIDLKIESKSKFSIKENTDEKERYIRLLENAIEKIQNEKVEKIVVSRKISAEYELDNPAELLLKLIKFYPEAFTYVWFHPEIGFWAGASPEILAKTYRNQFETMALAGTMREGEDRDWTEKEKHEQQIVTDEIVKGLKNHATSIEVSDRKTDKAGQLLHLRTDIKANLKSRELSEVLKELHPTPAVCGLPKEKAYEFLIANENYERQFYTGYFGELNMLHKTQRSSRTRNQENQAYKSIGRSSNLYVNLRCLSYKDGEINIYVGGGITKVSKPEEEWEETVNKSKTMLKVL